MDKNQLTCSPWSKHLNNIKLELLPANSIPFDELEKMKIKNSFPDNEIVRKWIHNQITTRVILLGAPGSGKSTFLRLVSDQTKFPTENLATDGISITTINNITFWDFGGQEVLFSTHKFFLVDRCQYILVVDLNKFNHENKEIKNECLKYVDYWMKEIHSFTVNYQYSPPVIILGTHCDKISNNKVFTSRKVKEAKKLLIEQAKVNYLNLFPKIFTFYKSSWKSTLYNNISGILNQIQVNSERFIKKDLKLTSENDNFNHCLQYLILKQKIENFKHKKPIMLRNEFENEFFNDDNKEIIDKYTKLLKFSGIIETYRFESSAAIEIIFLDPKWLSEIFTSIVSIKLISSKNRRGFFTKNQIKNNLSSHNVEELLWDEIIKIFEMFQLIVLLPSGVYYIPSMLHTPKSTKPSHLGEEKNQLIKSKFKEKNIKYKCIRRKFEFSPRIPFEFIDKIIVKYLNFPGIIMHDSTWINDFYLYSNDDGNNNHRFYHILIQIINNKNEFTNNELLISIFYPENEENKENNLYFSFFSHFIFQSPHDILSSSIYSTFSIEKIEIFEKNLKKSIGEEKNILFNYKQYFNDFKKYFIPSYIKIFDSDIHKCEFIKKLGFGRFGQVYSGKIKFNLQSKIKHDVVFKEARVISFESLKKLINEMILMKIIENQFTLKLYGICIPSMRLLDTRNKIQDNYDPNSSLFDEEKYLNHQLLLIIEEAPWGDLTHCHDIIQEKNSTKLKLKIAFDIVRGLHSLYLKSGVKLIHRDVKAENIFIFSLDENSVSSFESIHAKLGDFGSIVVSSPYYSQRIGNYQYTAPEALRGCFSVPYSKEIDVYSFGILLWEILTGKIPFQELKENPETCDAIEDLIINGYRPSLDFLPDDTPFCIIEIIKSCWNSKPKERPSLGKIISILTIILQFNISNELEIQLFLPSIEYNFEMKQKIIGKNINSSFFSNFQFKAIRSNGIVMICDFYLDENLYNVALKMLIDENCTNCNNENKNEFNILPQIQQHPNIICFLGSFYCIPSDDMINCFDQSTRDLCFNNKGMKKKCHFYILQEYEKTLASTITNLNENQILRYSIQLSSALLFLYYHNIVHLHITLDNLMISFSDDLVIVDFRFASKMNIKNGEIQLPFDYRENLFHLAPEILCFMNENKNLSCKFQHSWELGIIMFQMFNKGQFPYKNYDNLFSFSENPLDLSQIPCKFHNLLSSLLCPKNERISIAEAHEALLQFDC